MPFAPVLILSYFFAVPPIAGMLLFTMLSLGELSIWDWLGALPPVAGFSYILGAVPAIATAVTAGFVHRSATWWGRTVPPVVVAYAGATLMVWAVLLRGVGLDLRLMTLPGAAAACSAGLIGGLLEGAKCTVFQGS